MQVTAKVQVESKVKPCDRPHWGGCALRRATATPAQINSTTPKGQAPDKNPYTLDSTQPSAAEHEHTPPGLQGVHHHHERDRADAP